MSVIRPSVSITQALMPSTSAPALGARSATVLAIGSGTVDVRLDDGTIHRGLPLSGATAVGDRATVQWSAGKPYAHAGGAPSAAAAGLVTVLGSGGGGAASGAPSPHGLSSVHHSGEITTAQATWAMPLAGGTFTGNVGASTGVTIDGVDISAHAANANAHHNQQHLITSSDHTAIGSPYQLVGLTGTNALGLLTPATTVGANQIPIGGAAGAITWSGLQTFNAGATVAAGQTLTTPAITAAANLVINPAGDVTFDPAGNDILPNSNYDLNIGGISKKYLTLHVAELWVETLVAQDVISTIGGHVIVAPTTVLTSDIAADATTIYLKHNQPSAGDRLMMMADGKFEVMVLTSNASGTGPYEYTVTRNADGTGANAWYAGDALVNTGITDSGHIDMYSLESINGMHFDHIYVDDGGVFAGNYAGYSYFALFPATIAANDSLYIGMENTTWGNVFFHIATAGVFTSTSWAYEYWNGSTWAAMTTTSTPTFTATGETSILFAAAAQTDWARTAVNSVTAYWIRMRVTSAATWTTAPVQGSRRVRGNKSHWGPTIVGNVRNSTAFNDWTERWALGNLNGLYGFGTDIYGAGFGKYADDSSFLTIDATNGIRIISRASSANTTIAQWAMDGAITVGKVAAGQDNIYIAAGALSIRNNTTERIGLTAAGVLTIKDSGGAAVFTFNSSAGAEFTKPLTLGTAGGIYQGTGTFASPTTGLKLWNDSGIGRLAGYGTGEEQWSVDTSGRLVAGTDGQVRLDKYGLSILAGSEDFSYSTAFWFRNAVTSPEMWGISAYEAGNTSSMDLRVENTTRSGMSSQIFLKATPYGGQTGTITLSAGEGGDTSIEILDSAAASTITLDCITVTATKDLAVSANAGIGTAPVATNGITSAIVGVTSTVYGVYSYGYATPTTAQAALSAVGVNGLGVLTGAYDWGSLYGGRFVADHGATGGTLTNAFAGYFLTRLTGASGSPVITGSRGIEVATPTRVSASATIGTQYGLLVRNQATAFITTAYGVYLESITGATNNWSIYSAGGAGYHAGSWLVGTTTAAPNAGSVRTAKGMVTPEGGWAILCTAGENLTAGQIVQVYTSTSERVVKAAAGSVAPVGVVYATATSGNPVWIVVAGFAEVTFGAGVTPYRGEYAFVNATTAGVADRTASPTAAQRQGKIGMVYKTGTEASTTTCVVNPD